MALEGCHGFRVRQRGQWAGAEGQPLGVDTALYSAPWLWEGDRSLTVEPPSNSKGEELGPKVQEREKKNKNGSLWGCRAESPGLLRRLQKGQWGQKEKVSPE